MADYGQSLPHATDPYVTAAATGNRSFRCTDTTTNASSIPLCEFGHQGLIHDEELTEITGLDNNPCGGLIYNRARYLHPGLGRFMQRDSIGYDSGTLNLYEYVGGNSLVYVDPNGLYSISEYWQDFKAGVQAGADQLEIYSRNVRRFYGSITDELNESSRCTDNWAKASSLAFAGSLVNTFNNMLSGAVDVRASYLEFVKDLEKAKKLWDEEGWHRGAGHMIGVNQLVESYWNINLSTHEAIGDTQARFEHAAEGFFRISAAAGTTAGILKMASNYVRIIQPSASIPPNAKYTLKHIRDTGMPPQHHRGGSTFHNDGRNGGQVLPQHDASGNNITYREYDVNPYTEGVNRGPERIVFGSDGKAYYTNDHYATFTEITDTQ